MRKQSAILILIGAIIVISLCASSVGTGGGVSSAAMAPRTKTPTPTTAPTATPTPSGPTATPASGPPNVTSTELSAGWALVSANNVADGGATVSTVGYDSSTWYPITIPSTVLAGLVANNVYQNIYFGENLKTVPDLTRQNWWYRSEFTAPANGDGQQYWLRFKGISYRAQIWLNGTQIDANAVGSLVVHEYNVTNLIQPGAANAVAVLVTPPASGCNDLSFCTVDWNPPAPDANAGIWGKVFLDTTGRVALRDPYVQTTLPLPATNSADLTVYVDAVNGSANTVTGTVSGTITKSGFPTISFNQSVTLNPGERREVAFTPAAFSQLHVTNPALWWPYFLGSPQLYQLSVSFTGNAQTWDSKTINFGIRQITDYRITANGKSYAGYKVNGQNILVRGGGYMWDLLMRWDTPTNEAHMRYVKDMGLNTVRFEGTIGNEELYDIADREGLLLMPGFVCCSKWESASSWNVEDHNVAYASLDSQMRSKRAHPSMLVWTYGSDTAPPATELNQYKAIAASLHWQNPTLDNVATWSNPNAGAKMDGPYKWEPPHYWYLDSAPGGGYGFTAEEGYEAPPPEESLRKFIPAAQLWPIGTAWNYHSGKSPSVFDNLTVFTTAVNARYGTTTSVTEYSDRSQLLSYESDRAFFESWASNAYTKATGSIFWMLNNAWPSVHWNLYDYYMKPGGGYFGTKKATEPVHILYDYVTNNVKVYNSTLTGYTNLTATARVYNIPTLQLMNTTTASINVPANATTQALTIPAIGGLSTTYFIRLDLTNSTGQTVSSNLYWYSTTPDVLGNKSTWYMTATKSYANLTGLNTLASNSSVTASALRTVANGQETVTITLNNPSATALAFFMRAEVTKGSGGEEVLPVTYTDNYVTLWPGQSMTITAKYATSDLGGQPAYLRVRGYNVPEFSIPIP